MKRIVILFAALALSGAPTLVAQETEADQNPHARRGFWIGLGVGFGNLGIEGVDGRESSGTGMVKLGGTLSDKLLLGFQSNAWTKSEGGATITYGTATLGVQFYPSATGGFHLIGGVGGAVLSASLAGFGSDSEVGPGALLGVGYDFRVGRNISISPYLQGLGGTINGVTISVGTIGVGVTFH